MLLTYYSSNPLKPNTTCVISVFNPDLTHPPSVIAHFISFSTDYSKGCLYSRMDIYDGIDANPNKAFTGMYDAYRFHKKDDCTTGITCVAGSAYPSGSHKFTLDLI